MMGNTTDITTASANTASVGPMVRRSMPRNRTSAGTQPASGSNRRAEVEELSVSGSGILPILLVAAATSEWEWVESNDSEEGLERFLAKGPAAQSTRSYS